ncbi:hypothetical protein [Aeoliella sp.]|uniref:hypothetical protein n=1 Tax=Aeoliella sp. TaxID=2795800 RepID=UPI003CCBFAB8
MSEFDLNGGEGHLMSQSSINNADGITNSLASLSGPTELPVLRAESYSFSNSRASAEAFGMQGFYVTEPEYTLDVALAGIALDVPEPTIDTFNEDGSAVAHVMIFRNNDPSSDFYYTSHYPTMRGEAIPGNPNLELLAESVDGSGLQELVITPDNQVHIVGTTLTATGLQPNDLIYVWASLVTSGTRGGFGDAFNTLTMEFEDPVGLSHSPHNLVPEPTSLVLAGCLVSLVAFRRLRLCSR